MTVEELLKAACTKLQQADIATARLDMLVLLEDELGVDRAKLLAYPDMEITAETLNVLTQQVSRRAQHEPLAYIRGKTEFYGREFLITKSVLEPRPESETMIELLKEYVASNTIHNVAALLQISEDSSLRRNDDKAVGWRIADVGTGSGSLGITAQLELPDSSVELLEIDDEAIKVAQSNVIKFTSGNRVFKTDLLDGSRKEYDILLCNLPYVPDEYAINAAAQHEPALAIFGGPDGLDLYRTLFQQIEKLAKRPLLILCESLPAQHRDLQVLAEQYNYVQDIEADFIQAFVLNA